ncbi:hypothetical protein CAG99_18950 [Streptomyces marincola]|uniref:Secreted protein n=1 Tax=Streptomyces marincola TaxID=2878388 RepID=A0A1W7D6E3_9ACTN|nr:hypothetical protein [Streptomyces marincola]ARQ72479.1 hypothetical protein CAG99_18950 [Streptomyces marincola]UCM91758.1 hypothetical protein LC193_09160 [Streptomyces marincola]
MKNSKRGARAATVSVGALLLTLMASPAAQALTRDDGDDPGTGLSVAETIGYFVVTPIVLFAVITGLVILSDRKR